MVYKVRFKREALEQLDALYRYIIGENPAVGQKILARVHMVFVRLGDFPLLGRVTDEEAVHCVVIGKTGLLVFYTFDADVVTIVRILHERQKRS